VRLIAAGINKIYHFHVLMQGSILQLLNDCQSQAGLPSSIGYEITGLKKAFATKLFATNQYSQT